MARSGRTIYDHMDVNDEILRFPFYDKKPQYISDLGLQKYTTLLYTMQLILYTIYIANLYAIVTVVIL